MNTLGARLKAARKKAGLTQTRLARMAGCSHTTISDLERGRNRTSKELYELARGIGISVEELMEGADSPEVQDSTPAPSRPLSVTEMLETFVAKLDRLHPTKQQSVKQLLVAYERDKENRKHLALAIETLLNAK